MYIVFYVAQGVILLAVLLRLFYFYKYNPPKHLGAKFGKALLFKFVMYTTQIWSNVMFAIAFFMNMYWFVMYKMQDNAFLLLPGKVNNQEFYNFFFTFFLLILAAKFFNVILAIWEQSFVEVFVMDWENINLVENIRVGTQQPMQELNNNASQNPSQNAN